VKFCDSKERTKLDMRAATALIIALFAVTASAATDAELVASARTAMMRAEFEQAATMLEKAVALNPKNAKAHYYLGAAYGRQAEKAGMFGGIGLAKKAKAALEKSIQLDPNDSDARFALIDYYLVAPGIVGGSEEKAIAMATELRKRDALDGHRAFARVYARQKKPDLARKELVDAVREQPNSAKAHYFLGRFYFGEKNWKESLHEYEMAVKLDASFMPSYYRIGEHAADSGSNYARGEETLRRYLAHTPAENEPSHANAWLNLGAIQEKQGRKADARQSYLNAQKLAPKSKTITEALKRVS
jgi:tetratricopeptide (TPR) repeat protein